LTCLIALTSGKNCRTREQFEICHEMFLFFSYNQLSVLQA